jgi:hypothetical protein
MSDCGLYPRAAIVLQPHTLASIKTWRRKHWDVEARQPSWLLYPLGNMDHLPVVLSLRSPLLIGGVKQGPRIARIRQVFEDPTSMRFDWLGSLATRYHAPTAMPAAQVE